MNSRLQRQLTAYQRNQKTLRIVATDVLQDDIIDVVIHLLNAQVASEHNEIDTMVEQLDLARLTLYDAQASLELYEVVLFHDQPGRHLEVDLTTYASQIEDLEVAIDQRDAILPADLQHLSVFQADVELMRSTFTPELFRAGRYEDIVKALTTFCLENQLHTMLYGDARPRAEHCTLPPP
ncbi:MAG TPA: hypothetical protein VD886_19935 [Herpetosiphonaceae bacterium]|nr:hypothetical protein [Herpetosiphonaceae bacterium]